MNRSQRKIISLYEMGTWRVTYLYNQWFWFVHLCVCLFSLSTGILGLLLVDMKNLSSYRLLMRILIIHVCFEVSSCSIRFWSAIDDWLGIVFILWQQKLSKWDCLSTRYINVILIEIIKVWRSFLPAGINSKP